MAPKVALVTGGSSGIGAAVCEALLGQRYHVISLARHPANFSRGSMECIDVDLTDPQATLAVAAEVMRRHPVTTLVHNAGAVREQPLEAVSLADLDALTSLHVGAAITLLQAALPAMRAQHFGRVVLISTRAVLGLARRTVYSATKAAMLGLARTWALELGPLGVTINVVAPGPIEGTELFHEIVPRGSEQLEKIASGIPVRRLGRPTDVARAVMFFLAPEAEFITGQTLFVCGGTSVGSIVY